MEYIITEKLNRADIFHKGTTEPDIGSPFPLSITENLTRTSLSPSRVNLTRSTSSKFEFQYYLIGVYAFFAAVFTIVLITIVAKKIKQACCSSTMDDLHDYESMPNEGNDNAAFEQCVNVDSLDTERTPEHDSDYDCYTDTESETDSLKDRPPEYEHPPSYSLTLST